MRAGRQREGKEGAIVAVSADGRRGKGPKEGGSKNCGQNVPKSMDEAYVQVFLVVFHFKDSWF